jgi:dihydroorotate dehydrogenase
MRGRCLPNDVAKELIPIPDWSYRTLFRPLLFQLPAELARDFTLKSMGLLSKLPGGSLVIRTLGHMELSPILDTTRLGIRWKYPVGLSGGLDSHGDGLEALSQIGFGFIELGPITVNAINSDKPLQRDPEKESIIYASPDINDGLDTVLARLQRPAKPASLPLILRLRSMPGSTASECIEQIHTMAKALTPYAAAFSLDILDQHEPGILASCMDSIRSAAPGKPLFLHISPDSSLNDLDPKLMAGSPPQPEGYVIGSGRLSERGYEVGHDAFEPALRVTKLLSERKQPDQVMIMAGGIHEPADALQALDAGADFVQLHSGLVYSGPGLPKRINEAIIYERIQSLEPPAPPSFWKHWGWMCLLGIGMILGGLLAWLIATSRVLLPYDEAFLGMDRMQLHAINDRLISFMSHDRLTLAGTMISIGILYYQLARHGLRRELHWAKTASLTSGIVGFSSFFLYLGYGYFDPLHAMAAAILLPMFILAMRGRDDRPSRRPPNLYNDRVWLLAQWGQLMFVLLGGALAVGGLTIAFVGVTDVFVHTDLMYLRTTSEQLALANPKLIPVIAHDRAGFGGALFSDAVAILAIALWGIQQGERWVWWTLLLGGIPGFAAGLGVHMHIGYIDFIHLLPLYAAIALYAAGLALLYPYLCGSSQKEA